MFEPAQVTLFSHIFISNTLLSSFLIRYVWTCSSYVCSYITKSVKDMFETVDFHCAAEVRNFCKLHIALAFHILPHREHVFPSSAGHIYRFSYLLYWLQRIFLFLNQVNNNRLKQKFNKRSNRSHVYIDWWGNVADWETNGMFDWKNQTQINARGEMIMQDFSPNESVLKQHHSDPKIKKEK